MLVEEILDVLSLSSTTILEDEANLLIEGVREVRMCARGCMSGNGELDTE